MITSYNSNLPTTKQITEILENSTDTTASANVPNASILLWEDGGGNEIRLIKQDETYLILLYDNESEQNHYPDYPNRQTALRDIPDEVEELIEELKPELLWSWDDTNEIWYTAAFWNTGNNWETSYDWEENHDEDSVEWMFRTIEEELINKN